MNTVFESGSVKIGLDAKKSMIILKWLDKTAQWTEDDFIRENQNIVKVVAEHKPTYLLSLSQDFMYPITPNEQVWLVDNVFVPHHQNGVRKMALIMSQDFISQLSIEQLVDETSVVPTGMFATEEEAERWLFA
ncbi:MAG TPA: hypothetical protein DCM08_07140 [Microscillaceae bacterium]|jgi:hypothetical protein|nr:hypothetical protein [Microscillaceae bacterium]